MPQLDFSTPLTTSQLVWGAIIFVVLYIMLSRSGLPLVASVLEERAAHIGRDLDGARSAKSRADAGIAEAGGGTRRSPTRVLRVRPRSMRHSTKPRPRRRRRPRR